MKKPQYVLPANFVDRLKSLASPQRYQSILTGFAQMRPTTLRVNTLKSNIDELKTLLTKRGISFQIVSWYRDALIIPSAPLRSLADLPEYEQGIFYVQNLSSMIPPLVLNPQPGEKILDLTAAPGSKTSQMAALMENTGEIVASDNSQIRLYRLTANLTRLGVTNTRVMRAVGQSLWQKYPEYFDKTLLDAPCSMEGRINSQDPDSYKDWSVKRIKELAKLQRFLLRSAISATKVGGNIVYSTCTLAPEENEQIIDWILGREGDAVSVESIQLNIPDSTPGLTQWGTRSLSPDMKKTLRIWPGTAMEGFFVTKLRKLKSTVPQILQ